MRGSKGPGSKYLAKSQRFVAPRLLSQQHLYAARPRRRASRRLPIMRSILVWKRSLPRGGFGSASPVGWRRFGIKRAPEQIAASRWKACPAVLQHGDGRSSDDRPRSARGFDTTLRAIPRWRGGRWWAKAGRTVRGGRAASEGERGAGREGKPGRGHVPFASTDVPPRQRPGVQLGGRVLRVQRAAAASRKPITPAPRANRPGGPRKASEAVDTYLIKRYVGSVKL